jgi:hypothetical protein
VFGLWIGMIFGSLFMSAYYKWLLDHYFDWEKLIEEAASRQDELKEDSTKAVLHKNL